MAKVNLSLYDAELFKEMADFFQEKSNTFIFAAYKTQMRKYERFCNLVHNEIITADTIEKYGEKNESES